MRLGQRGPVLAARPVESVLARPHQVVLPSDSAFTMRRADALDSSLVVLGRDAFIAGSVRGDLLVIGGDLYLRPGARIAGRAIAIGGAVYPSTLAITGPQSSYRNFTYDAIPAASGYVLDYRLITVSEGTPVLTWPGIYGLEIPTYDRTNGLSIGLSPLVTLAGAELRIEPRITYRSQLGRIDPSVGFTAQLGAYTTLQGFAGRATYSNDAWIWSDFVNSLETFVSGHDTRNAYRASRAEASVAHVVETSNATIEPYFGARFERAASVGPWPTSTGGPWSVFGRNDRDEMLRPNVPVENRDYASLIGGADLHGESQGVQWRARFDVEGGKAAGSVVAPLIGLPGRSFTQATFDGRITFATFGSQSLRVDGHAVMSGGGTPTQRFAFLGGPGTISTISLLSQGGDRLVFLDGRYSIPLSFIALPLAGSPRVVIRDVIGGAGVGKLPALEQAIGARLYLSLVYGEVMVDPVTRRLHAGLGLSLAR